MLFNWHVLNIVPPLKRFHVGNYDDKECEYALLHLSNVSMVTVVLNMFVYPQLTFYF